MKTTDFVENLLVQKVLKGGRKYGIHLLAVTQSLNDGVGASILNNIRLRIALPMNETQSNNFLSHRNSAAKNLEKHHAVYNDQRGEVEGNQIFKITKAS
jgi:DNA segregation ATPase FtsK/SpoIIIE-like protein